jgi:hypothetical protein
MSMLLKDTWHFGYLRGCPYRTRSVKHPEIAESANNDYGECDDAETLILYDSGCFMFPCSREFITDSKKAVTLHGHY